MYLNLSALSKIVSFYLSMTRRLNVTNEAQITARVRSFTSQERALPIKLDASCCPLLQNILKHFWQGQCLMRVCQNGSRYSQKLMNLSSSLTPVGHTRHQGCWNWTLLFVESLSYVVQSVLIRATEPVCKFVDDEEPLTLQPPIHGGILKIFLGKRVTLSAY